MHVSPCIHNDYCLRIHTIVLAWLCRVLTSSVLSFLLCVFTWHIICCITSRTLYAKFYVAYSAIHTCIKLIFIIIILTKRVYFRKFHLLTVALLIGWRRWTYRQFQHTYLKKASSWNTVKHLKVSVHIVPALLLILTKIYDVYRKLHWWWIVVWVIRRRNLWDVATYWVDKDYVFHTICECIQSNEVKL